MFINLFWSDAPAEGELNGGTDAQSGTAAAAPIVDALCRSRYYAAVLTTAVLVGWLVTLGFERRYLLLQTRGKGTSKAYDLLSA